MDPDKALAELRQAVEALKADFRAGEHDIGENADRLVVKFEALDGWLSCGGAIPREWKQHG